MSNFSSLTKMTYTTHGTHGVNQDGFDNSKDRFVAPVDGVYHFYVRHWYQSGTTNSTVWLYLYRRTLYSISIVYPSKWYSFEVNQ